MKTCCNPDAVYEFPKGRGEVCVCDDGFVMMFGLCLPVVECGCWYEEDEKYLEVSSFVEYLLNFRFEYVIEVNVGY